MWTDIILNKWLVLDRNTCNHTTVCKLIVLDWNTCKGKSFTLRIVTWIYNCLSVFTPLEFFTPALTDGFSLEFEW